MVTVVGVDKTVPVVVLHVPACGCVRERVCVWGCAFVRLAVLRE